VIGSAGPTTSSRLDAYTPALLALGLKGMIGKGYRNPVVREAIVRHGCVYFVTVGGAAALVAERIKHVAMIAFDDLGTEAIQKLVVEDFPLVVANDSHGGDLFETGRAAYAKAPTTI
jgi:fumarate hydratase subunit beta